MMRRLLQFLLALALAVSLRAEDLYVTQAGAGSKNGTSLANAWEVSSASTGINNSGNWGVGAGKVSAGDNLYVSGVTTGRITLQGSGTSTSARINIIGINSGGNTAGIDSNGQDYIALIGLDISQTSSSNTYPAVSMYGCTGWLIYKNTFHGTYYEAIANPSGSLTDNDSNIIRRNTFDDISGIDTGATSSPNIQLWCDNNLVEYNSITKGLDRVRFYGTANVIRNNYFGATDTALYPSTSQYPHHTDDFQSFENATRTVSQVMFERNYCILSTDSVSTGLGNSPNAHGLVMQNANASSMAWLINRFNVRSQYGGQDGITQDYDQNFHYNNTSYKVNNGYSNPSNNAWVYQSPASATNDWRNNT